MMMTMMMMSEGLRAAFGFVLGWGRLLRRSGAHDEWQTSSSSQLLDMILVTVLY